MTRRSSWFRNLLWEFKFTEIETVVTWCQNQIIELKGYLRKIRATSGADIIIIGRKINHIKNKKVLSEDVCKNNVFPNNITRCKYALEIFTSPNYFTSNNVQGGKTLLLSCSDSVFNSSIFTGKR
ncbi:uncharacterized protein OCT59_002799 [Rhizophagus irregularis]|uniref:uncharacterized protein n=1 Tax=Rhizophagus irregularis TaxID=588596 RepID=UPI00332DDCE2|nr:hypothetical protein OCT59_002799 [Rhizophagus irregularis]